MPTVEDNAAFLTNLFLKGPFEGHGIMCTPPGTPSYQSDLGDYTVSERPISEWVPQRVEDYRRQIEYLELEGNHAVPRARLGCGTHLYAAAFGCAVHQSREDNPFALPLVHGAEEADQLAEPKVWEQRPLTRVFELADALRTELGDEVYLSPPDVQSGFDTACLVWDKASLLVAMLTEPDAVKRLVGKCASLLRSFLGELRKEFPMLSPAHCPDVWAPPDLAPWLSNDECGVFNTACFEEFCLPELVEFAETFGGMGMHCCADAEHQFESFKKIPGFYALHRHAGRRGWNVLLDYFDGPEAPVLVLDSPTVEIIEGLIRQAAPETRFLFGHCAESLDDGKDWLARVHAIAG